MADIQSRDPLGASAGQPGSSKHQQGSGGTSSGGMSGGGTSSGGMADQAKETLRTVTDRASDTWDDVSWRGADYYRQGARTVGGVDNATMTALLVAGAVGLGLGWLIFGQRSYSGDYVAKGMSRSSERDY
jgi:hypothetical protein